MTKTTKPIRDVECCLLGVVVAVAVIGGAYWGLNSLYWRQVAATREAYAQFGNGFSFEFKKVVWNAYEAPQFFWVKDGSQLVKYKPFLDQRASRLVTKDGTSGLYLYYLDVAPGKSSWARLRPPNPPEQQGWIGDPPTPSSVAQRWVMEIHLHDDEIPTSALPPTK